MPLFSVILTASARPRLLRRALRSLFSQSCKDWELVLAIDGEDPEVLDIAADLRDTQNVIVSFVPFPVKEQASGVQPAEGPIRPIPVKRLAVAVNHAMGLATGKWFTYLCDDDEYLPGRFERYLPHLDLADVVCGHADFVDLQGAVKRSTKLVYRYPEPKEPGHAELVEAIYPCNFICQDSVVHRRTELRWPTDDDPTPCDWRFWLRLRAAGFRFRRIGTVGERALMPGSWRAHNPTEEQVLALTGERLGGGTMQGGRVTYAKNVTRKKQVVSTRTGGSIVVHPGERIDARLVSHEVPGGGRSIFPGFALCGDFSFPETLDDLKPRPSITQQRRRPLPEEQPAEKRQSLSPGEVASRAEAPPEEGPEEISPFELSRPRSFEPISGIKGGTLLTAQGAEPKHPFDID